MTTMNGFIKKGSRVRHKKYGIYAIILQIDTDEWGDIYFVRLVSNGKTRAWYDDETEWMPNGLESIKRRHNL